MDNICFVIMPFGIGFDDLYEKVYVPAIQSQGLSPLRADEIYDNQPIIRVSPNPSTTPRSSWQMSQGETQTSTMNWASLTR